MVSRMEDLSTNLVVLLQELVRDNENLAEYLLNESKSPLTDTSAIPVNFDYEDLIMSRIIPFPFDDINEEMQSEIRVFYHHGEMDLKGKLSDNVIIFDILVPKLQWLINDGKPSLRPYDMMANIINRFADKSVGTMGKLNFFHYAHLMVNDKISGIRLFAETSTVKI